MKIIIATILLAAIAFAEAGRGKGPKTQFLEFNSRGRTTANVTWPVIENVTEYTVYYTEYLLADVAAKAVEPVFHKELGDNEYMTRVIEGLPKGYRLSFYVALSDPEGRPNERNGEPIWGKRSSYKMKGKPDGSFTQQGGVFSEGSGDIDIPTDPAVVAPPMPAVDPMPVDPVPVDPMPVDPVPVDPVAMGDMTGSDPAMP